MGGVIRGTGFPADCKSAPPCGVTFELKSSQIVDAVWILWETVGMEQDPTKMCKSCGNIRHFSEMEKFKGANGKMYARGRCLRCAATRKRTWNANNPEKALAAAERYSSRQKLERLSPNNWAKWIVRDSKSSDRKRGLENDLTVEFVQALIVNGCSYCGESNLRMTVDRVDNALGHTRDNVVSACIRCNYTRKDMPHEAWCVIAGAMREARLCGLLGSWTGRVR